MPQPEPRLGDGFSNQVDVVADGAFGPEGLKHRRDILLADLDHRAQLLGKERSERVRTQRPQVHVEAGASRKRHLHERDEEPAVRTIVVGEDEPHLIQELDDAEE